MSLKYFSIQLIMKLIEDEDGILILFQNYIFCSQRVVDISVW